VPRGARRCGRGLRLHVANAADCRGIRRPRPLARLWERESALAHGVLLVELEDGPDPDVLRRLAASSTAVGTPVLVSAAEPPRLGRRLGLQVDVPRRERARESSSGSRCSARRPAPEWVRSTR